MLCQGIQVEEKKIKIALVSDTRSGQGCLVLGLKISNGYAKGWIVLLANGAGSGIDVLVEEFCRSVKPAVGPEGEGSELEEIS